MPGLVDVARLVVRESAPLQPAGVTSRVSKKVPFSTQTAQLPLSP
jgi:hypothetical protein